MKKKISYNNDIILTFDIETTNLVANYNGKEIKMAFAYSMCFNFNGLHILKRTWEDTIAVLDYISNSTQVDKKIVCYVHNLSFEFQFMKSYIKFDNVFCRKAHKVLKATYKNIEFRCSLFLANTSLAKLAENEKLSVKKMNGDLDYNLIRHNNTPLTKEELGYIYADVDVVYEYVKKKLKEYGSYAEIPMTSTGEVRYFFRKELGSSLKKIHNTALLYSAPSKELQNMLIKAYAGAYTHANYQYIGLVLKLLGAIDISSSYPFQMCARKFPTTWWKIKESRYENLADLFEKYNPKEYAICCDIDLYGISVKHCHSILSRHKANKIAEDVIEDNGRINNCSFASYTVTEIDLKNIFNFYNIEDFDIYNIWVSKKEYLPKEIVSCILKLFRQKTALKDIEEEYENYMRSKNKINGVYGTTVFNILKTMFEYDADSGSFIKNEKDWGDFQQSINNPNNYLWYSIGVWVTAYARNQILEPIKKMSENAVYSDTDSVKYRSPKRYKKLLEKLNAKYKTLFNNAMKYHKFSLPEYTFYDKYGRQHYMGIFEEERPYTRFKTLGAKRYIYEYAPDKKDIKKGITSPHCHTTVAGAPKNLVDFLGETNDEKFLNFTHNFSLKKCKNTHTYTEHNFKYLVKDYKGVYKVCDIKSGICITPADFTMKMSDLFLEFLAGQVDFDNADIYSYFIDTLLYK